MAIVDGDEEEDSGGGGCNFKAAANC